MSLKLTIKHSLEDFLEDKKDLPIDLDKLAEFIEDDISDEIDSMIEDAVEEAEDDLRTSFESDPLGYIKGKDVDALRLQFLGITNPSLADISKLEWIKEHWDKIDPYK